MKLNKKEAEGMRKVKALLLMVSLFCLLMASQAMAESRLVLFELFTNTGCSPCYNANNVLDQIADNYPDTVVCVRYHTSGPSSSDPFYQYNPTENNSRAAYYGITGVPTGIIDGFINVGSVPGIYWNTIKNRYGMEPALKIELSGTYNEAALNGSLDIKIEAIDYNYFEQLYVRIALTESNIRFQAPNGCLWHDQTMRDMIPHTNGRPIEIDYGETVEFSQAFYTPEQLDVDNCELVVWVQCEQMKEIYQAAHIKISNLERVDIEDDYQPELPGSFALSQNYPNPFNASTIIDYKLEKESPVDLAVYDLGGRKVAQLAGDVQSAGSHSVIWNGQDDNGKAVSTGIYFYRLQTNEQSVTKRMTLLK
jgi:thiol-disulfide isomerase/thioredoxin